MPTLPEKYHNIHYVGNRSHFGRYYRHPATPPLRDTFEFITRIWTDFPTEQFFEGGSQADNTVLLNAESVSGSVKIETFPLHSVPNDGMRTWIKKTDAVVNFNPDIWQWEELTNAEGNVMAVRAKHGFDDGMGYRITYQPINSGSQPDIVPAWADDYSFIDDWTPI